MRKPLLALLLLLLAACSRDSAEQAAAEKAAPRTPPPPAAEEAATMIENSPSFGEFEFTAAGYSIPVTGGTMSEPVRATVRDLAAAGWLTTDGSGNVMLTDRASGDRRFILRPNGILDIVPLARKEMGEVEAVRQNDDGTAAVDFTWRWIPNEVGSAFKSGAVAERFAGTQHATATLIWNGSEWSVLKIERRQPAG